MKIIFYGNFYFKMIIDVFLEGWGVYCDGMEFIGGRWLVREIVENNYINCFEFEVVKLGL